jgi:hypothetical protein
VPIDPPETDVAERLLTPHLREEITTTVVYKRKVDG